MAKATHDPPTGRDDPAQAAHAWRRFRHLPAWMIAVAAACSGRFVALTRVHGSLRPVTMAAVIGGSIELAGAPMGLTFLGSGTGHGEDVGRRERAADRGRSKRRRTPAGLPVDKLGISGWRDIRPLRHTGAAPGRRWV